MKSLNTWRSRQLYESNDADFILPSERKRVGNELRNTETCGQILDSPFKKHVSSFKEKLTQLPTPQEEHKSGLGELGMDQVSKATFGEDPLKAGRTPTISKGMPVQEIAAAPMPQDPAQMPGAQMPGAQPVAVAADNVKTDSAPNNKLIPPPVQKLMSLLMRHLGSRNPQVLAATRDVFNQQVQAKLADKGRERWGAQTSYQRALDTKQNVGANALA